MPPLPSDLRNKLESAIIDARDVAEAGAKAALEALAVHHHEPYPHQKADQRRLRVQLRAHARQLGDTQNAKGELAIGHLVRECAYEHWHRMLFARFLAENDLLIEPDSGMAVSLTEAEELAKAAKGGGVDLWTYASRCAQQMLPQIFRPDDPLLQVGLANEHRVKLERLLSGLAPATFKADDSLGWVYQFWQSAEKKRVNDSGDKITGDTLPAVTQLFTEHYMVLFLLHNTIGAWHAGKVLAANAKLAESATSEEVLRQAVALKTGGGYSFDYLRFVRGADGKSGPWRPAAGTFAGWPKTAARLKMLDPCCGSGHFLVAGFELLVRLRMAEECLDLAHAVDAVLSENIFGLELDARCTQIAAFNLALAAWKLAGHRKLPPLHIACTGIGPSGTMEEWVSFAAKSSWRLPPIARPFVEDGLRAMHQLFSQAPTLGSLINPHNVGGTLITADYETLRPHLTQALSAELGDDLAHERAVAAAGMAKASEILAEEYTLVITNVPYLGRGKQGAILQAWAEEYQPDAKADLATMFVSRAMDWLANGGTLSVVSPQNWFFQPNATAFRKRILSTKVWNFTVVLGEEAWQSFGYRGPRATLTTVTRDSPAADHTFFALDVAGVRGESVVTIEEKVQRLPGHALAPIQWLSQSCQISNPDHRILLRSASGASLLTEHAIGPQGIKTGDDDRLRRGWWEITLPSLRWRYYAGGFDTTMPIGGLNYVIDWANQGNEFARLQGRRAWGADGVSVRLMGEIKVARYFGDVFDSNITAIVPKDRSNLAAVVMFCQSAEFTRAVKTTEQSVKANSGTATKVPFDLAQWQQVAAEKYPNGLPEPESNDPTQWLFHGRPEESTAPLHVAVARLLGYRWPAELDDKMRLSKRARGLVAKADALLKYADDDGIVCIPSVRGEEPAADRLLTLLAACGVKPDRNLDEWLRDDFFHDHCELFHNRPFIWHIWDGRKRDGFHALVNYHKLCGTGILPVEGKHGRDAHATHAGRKLLESLTYSYLGEWINRQKDGVKTGKDGAEDRLAAAMELQKRLVAILDGEPPFDLFVRWKPLAEQPSGWEPDINDGVRMNIRPFLANDLPGGRAGAGVLRWKPNIKWDKDRGTEPERAKSEYPWFWNWNEKTVDFMGAGKEPDGNRWNDCHYTIKAKQAARDAAKKGGK